jgi:hypothetical protein
MTSYLTYLPQAACKPPAPLQAYTVSHLPLASAACLFTDFGWYPSGAHPSPQPLPPCATMDNGSDRVQFFDLRKRVFDLICLPHPWLEYFAAVINDSVSNNRRCPAHTLPHSWTRLYSHKLSRVPTYPHSILTC